jgi:methanol--5-hydroxybenzimidazolylcobamide Co-methyltransferase
MVLAEQGYIPRVLGAVARVTAATRTIVANEQGAVGPDKDCGYEGIIVKAITGTPTSMEGRVAAVAHLSRVGNISIAAADLWSNESIQHIKLLGGYAEVVSLEQLTYDARQFNTARKLGQDLLYRDVQVESDSHLDPHAWILRPDVALSLGQAIVAAPDNHFARAKAAAAAALKELQKAYDAKELKLGDREIGFLDSLAADVDAITDDEGAFIEEQIAKNTNPKFDPKLYDL